MAHDDFQRQVQVMEHYTAGPQTERAERSQNTDRDERSSPSREGLVVATVVDKRPKESELERLGSKVKFLENQLQRTAKELKIWQVRYPNVAANWPLADVDSQPELPPWMASEEMMTPLLTAYDSRIAELELRISRQRGEIDVLVERAESLSMENEDLRRTHISQIDCLAPQMEGGVNATAAAGIATKEMIRQLDERNKLLVNKNLVMADQVSNMGRELDRAHNEIKELEEQVAELTCALSETAGVARRLDKQVCDLITEKGRAEDEVGARTQALAEADNKIRQCMASECTLKEEKNAAQELNKELKRRQMELQRRNETDIEAMAAKVKSSAERVSELQGQLAAKSSEADVLCVELRRTRRELEQVRGDAEGMVQVIGGFEKQVANYANKEETALTIALESKQKVEDALLARDQTKALEVQARRELSRLMEMRKLDAATALQERDEAVSNLRTRLMAQIDSREQDIKQLSTECGRLEMELERAGREKGSAESLLEKLRESLGLDSEGGILDGTLGKSDHLSMRIKEAEAARHKAEKETKDAKAEAENIIRYWNTKEDTWRTKELHLQGTLRTRETELGGLNSSLRNAEERLEREERNNHRLRREVDEAKEEMSRRLEDADLSHTSELQVAKTCASQAQASMRDAELRLSSVEANTSKTIKAIRAEFAASKSKLLGQVEEESNRAAQMAAKNKEVLAKLSETDARCSDFFASLTRSQVRCVR